MTADRLAEYRRKRETGASGEPEGKRSGRAGRGDAGRFVIQRHAASSLHFDLRLEIDGVLVSWAVPKGPSLDPRVKRLATRTEDHPLDYADFEGRIGEGNYGAGTVIVWDRGTFENQTEHRGQHLDTATGLERGHLRVWLDGEKLTGAFALTRTRMRGDDRNWLLVKIADDTADRRRKPAKTQPESVISGRSNADGIEVGAAPFAERVAEQGAHWVRPELVAAVEFTEWTQDGKLRHPRYLGLRSDKPPKDVVREDR